MIRGAIKHLPGIGAETLKYLDGIGIREWQHILDQPDRIPVSARNRERIVEDIFRAEQALAEENIGYLLSTFARQDHWRILAHFFERASFFDIEITGPSLPVITTIACLHRGTLKTFLRGENLDDFLSLLEDVDLLVSFNGDSFDVPMVRRHFHIPALPCPHLDLRWVCYHGKLRGGLKYIERHLGLVRPPDLQGIDGEAAVWLWDSWKNTGDINARRKLERYCAADAASLKTVASRVLAGRGIRMLEDDPWLTLNALTPAEPPPPKPVQPIRDASSDIKRLQDQLQKMKQMRMTARQSSTTS